jgi:hypothetical protein
MDADVTLGELARRCPDRFEPGVAPEFGTITLTVRLVIVTLPSLITGSRNPPRRRRRYRPGHTS